MITDGESILCEQLMNKEHSEPVRAAMQIRGISICSQERADIRISWIPDKNASLRVTAQITEKLECLMSVAPVLLKHTKV